jgi:hypothetical protein
MSHIQAHTWIRKNLLRTSPTAEHLHTLSGIRFDFAQTASHVKTFHAAQYSKEQPPSAATPCLCYTKCCIFYPRASRRSNLTIHQPGFKADTAIHTLSGQMKTLRIAQTDRPALHLTKEYKAPSAFDFPLDVGRLTNDD